MSELKGNGEMSEDVAAEEKFLSAAKEGVHQLSNELELLVKVYNENLEQMVRMRINMEMLDYLIIAEPANNKHAEQRTNVKQSLSRLRKLIKVVRGQILQRSQDGKGKEKGNGEKD